MKKEVMKKWVKALRSGKYKRGSGNLRKKTSTGYRHCCLGVLCDITPGVEWIEYPGGQVSWASDELGPEDAVLPVGVMEYSGIGDEQGYMPSKKGKCTLVDINDSGKYSFNKIADIIEKHWESL